MPEFNDVRNFVVILWTVKVQSSVRARRGDIGSCQDHITGNMLLNANSNIRFPEILAQFTRNVKD